MYTSRIISSHFTQYTNNSAVNATIGLMYVGTYLYFNYDNAGTDLPAFLAWLAAEYAAGHPVTVEYELATPTTETVTVYPDIPTTYKTTQITVTDCDANVLPTIEATLKVTDT